MPLKPIIAMVTVVALLSAMSLFPIAASAGSRHSSRHTYQRAHHPRHSHHRFRHGRGGHRGHRGHRVYLGHQVLAGVALGTLVLGGMVAAYSASRYPHASLYRPVPVRRSYVWRARQAPAPRQAASVQQQYCREFQRDVIIDGKPERAYGTACLQPDGTWKIVP
ncbi:hypothetical protein NKDENANG_04051 [Candidatus Entotheonellaceae bacterium PAL068K]